METYQAASSALWQLYAHGPPLLTWINFKPSMDKWSYA